MTYSLDHPLCEKLGLDGVDWICKMKYLFPQEPKGKEQKLYFHYFTKLPREVQVAIWDMVIEEAKDKRPFVVAVDTNRTLLSSKFYSPLLEVCVASRQVYRRHFPCALRVMHSSILANNNGNVGELCAFSPCALGGVVHISTQTDLLIDLSAWWRYQNWSDPNHVAYYGQLVQAIRPHHFGFMQGFHKLKTSFKEYRTARSLGYQKAEEVQYVLFDMLHMPAEEFMYLHPDKEARSSIFSVHLAAKRK